VFQSLFSWNSPSDSYSGVLKCKMGDVSILVFLELALGLDRPEGFSSPARVSILVFLELALGPWTSRVISILRLRFNPCFLGTRPRTKVFGSRSASYLEFQSLFSWNSPSDSMEGNRYYPRPRVSILVFLELALGLEAGKSSTLTLSWFQSLFSWNSPSDRSDQQQGDQNCSVSILVFLELALGLRPERDNPDRCRSFNPCFLGTRPRTPDGCQRS